MMAGSIDSSSSSSRELAASATRLAAAVSSVSIVVAVVALVYSFGATFKPSEPYLVTWLTDTQGFTTRQVYDDIFPWWTYSYLAALLVLSVLAESRAVGHRCVVVFGGGCMVVASLLLMLPLPFPEHPLYLHLMQLDELAVGTAFASASVFYSYLLLLARPQYYQTIMSVTRSAQLLGSVSSSIIGQVLVSFGYLSIAMWISVGSMVVVFISTWFLPTGAKHSADSRTFKQNLFELYDSLRKEQVLLCTLYKIITLAVHQLALTYAQSLFSAIVAPATPEWNGIVYSVSYLLAAIAAVIPIFAQAAMLRWYIVILVVTLLVSGVLLLLMGTASSIWLAYVAFVVYHSLYEMVSSFTNAAIGIALETDRVAVVFGYSTAASLAVQTGIQVLVGSSGLSLPITQQFQVFGASLLASVVIVLTAAGLFAAAARRCSHGERQAVLAGSSTPSPSLSIQEPPPVR